MSNIQSKISVCCYLSLLLLIQGCGSTKHVSQYFKFNQYKKDFNQLITNDSVKILHQSFGDVKFETNRKKVNKIAAKSPLKPDHVLLYGKTVLPPHYEYFVLLDADKEISAEGVFTSDTIVNGHRFTFAGIPAEGTTIPRDFDRLASNFFALTEKESGKKKPAIGAFVNQFLKQNTYFKTMDQIAKYEVVGESEEWFRYQMELNYASFLGESKRYRELLKKFEGNLSADSIVTTIREKGVSGMDLVKEFVIEQVADQKLVMFNENHFYPSHRMLITALLPELKAAGFNYLAMEAITPGQEKKLNKGEAISFNTGFYTKEQRFGELIRTAQQLGIEMVSYESQGKNRESGQADNLYENTFKKDPDAKVIVYAGISHILEKPDARGKKWMAAVFKEKYKIDPVTFSQTNLLRYRKFVDDVSVIAADEFESEKLQNTDYQFVNNIDIVESIGNFTFENTFDFPVQIAIFDGKEDKDYTSLVPIRAAIIDRGEEYITNITRFDQVKVVITDIEGIVFKDADVKVSGR